MAEPKETRNDLLGAYVTEKLAARHFDAYYCPTAQQAVQKAMELIPEGSSVSWGGSMSIRDMGLTKALHAGNYNVLDRDFAPTPEEAAQIQRQALLTDYFLTSTNALSKDGILVNIDGTGNRVAAMCFGPKHVIVICGINKITPDLDSAVARARNTAAPINSIRLSKNTPCAKTGTCHNCNAPDCICAQFLISRICKPAKRIHVIIVGEELGY